MSGVGQVLRRLTVSRSKAVNEDEHEAWVHADGRAYLDEILGVVGVKLLGHVLWGYGDVARGGGYVRKERGTEGRVRCALAVWTGVEG